MKIIFYITYIYLLVIKNHDTFESCIEHIHCDTNIHIYIFFKDWYNY